MKHGTRTLEHSQGTKRRMATHRRCELWPSKANGKGDASWVIIGRRNHHDTPVCLSNQRPDSELAGLRQVDEGHVCPNGWWRMRESSIPNGLLLQLRAWQQKWSPSSAVIQLGKMEPAQQSLQQQHRGSASVHSRRSSTTKHQETSDQPDDAYTHITSYAHTTPICVPPLHIHTHNPHMHTHHSICTHNPCAYTPLHMHTHKPTPVINSSNLCHVSLNI